VRHAVRRRRRVRGEHRKKKARNAATGRGAGSGRRARGRRAGSAPGTRHARAPRARRSQMTDALDQVIENARRRTVSDPRLGVLGETLAVLEVRGAWLRVRTGDGYHAWVHSGYVATGTAEWGDDWSGRATARALGAEVLAEDGRPVRLPEGARVGLRRDGSVE